MSVSGRAFCLATLAAASILCGCAPPEVDLFDEDAAAASRVKRIRIKVTTIGGVTGEDYPEIAWHQIHRPYKQPYHPLTEGQLFEWSFLDELSQERKDIKKRAEQTAKKKPKPKKSKPKRPKKPKQKPKQKPKPKPEPAKKDEAKPKPETEPEPEKPKRSRRSRRSRSD